MDQNDLNRNLIGQGKKGSQNYQKRIQQIEAQIRVLKSKNNELQKQSDNDIDDQDIKKQIYQQTQFIEAEINKIKKLLEAFAQQFKDPGAKIKLKQMWKEASKQIQKNKIITERIVNEAPRQSFLNKEDRLSSSFIDKKNRKSYGNYDRKKSRQSQQIVKEKRFNNNMGTKQAASQEVFDDSDLTFQNQMVRQKNEVLNHLEQKNMKINRVMIQIALLVDEQGQHVNLITQNVNQAGEDVVIANEDLDQAIVLQKKARKKYCCIAVFMLIAVLVIGGIVFITVSNNDDEKK